MLGFTKWILEDPRFMEQVPYEGTERNFFELKVARYLLSKKRWAFLEPFLKPKAAILGQKRLNLEQVSLPLEPAIDMFSKAKVSFETIGQNIGRPLTEKIIEVLDRVAFKKGAKINPDKQDEIVNKANLFSLMVLEQRGKKW